MKRLVETAILLCLFASGVALAQQSATPGVPSTESVQDASAIKITRSGSQQSSEVSDRSFTGSVRIDSLFNGAAPSRVMVGNVTFQPRARTAWHTHPLGQFLIITAGTGWIQQWGGPIEEIRKGDVVWIPAGVKHWHGATPDTAMTHIAIQEQLNGKVVEWLQKVTDAQYRR